MNKNTSARLRWVAGILAVGLCRGQSYATSTVAIAKGSALQMGTLAVMPVIQIGGVTGIVKFAGLDSPGFFQFNVVVPPSASTGDNSLTAQYNGLTTQSGLALNVGGQ
jgi:uncharacterized protein (TIGR03437 family)